MLKKSTDLGIMAVLMSILFLSCKSHNKECYLCIEKKPETTDFTRQLNKIDHFVSVDSAMQWTKNFAALSQEILAGQFRGDTTLFPVYETFNLKIIDSIIANPTTIGFRIYLAAKSDNKLHFVITGVDESGRDVVLNAIEGRSSTMQQFQGGKQKTSPSAVGETGQRPPL